MKVRLLSTVVLALVLALAAGACSGADTPTVGPTPIPTPTPPEPPPTTVTLRGTVSAEDGTKVSGATVRILDGANADRSSNTNDSGEYMFDGLAIGNANLSVTATGYTESRLGVYIDGSNSLDFRLTPMILPPTTAYDGAWIGGGTGTASDSTPVTVGIELEVVGGAIKSWTLNYNFRDGTPPVQKDWCRNHLRGAPIPIVGNSFMSTMAEQKFYIYTPTVFKGTFSSTSAVTGTITLVYTIPLQSPDDPELRRACPASATIEWSAKR